VSQGSLDISTYQAPMASGVPVLDEAPSLRVRALDFVTDRVPAAAAGATLSLLFHAMLLTTILWASGARNAHPPDPQLSGSDQSQRTDDAAMQWIDLEMSPVPRAATPLNVSLVLDVAPLPSLQSELSYVAAELDTDFGRDSAVRVSSSADDSASDGAALVAMAGRYVGQINARIDRAWMRPRTAIGAPTFSCRVRIDQDRAGNVLDVTLERCNGDAHWQLSLVQAIESASPLPAPPDPAVFAPIVHMSFQAVAYRPGAPEGDYEPKGAAQVAQAAAPDEKAESALDRLREALLKAHPNEVIKLTITGSADGSPQIPKSSLAP
jgi:hypothetical protein